MPSGRVTAFQRCCEGLYASTGPATPAPTQYVPATQGQRALGGEVGITGQTSLALRIWSVSGDCSRSGTCWLTAMASSLQQSGDATYKVGQRIPVSTSEIDDIVAGIGRLVAGLRAPSGTAGTAVAAARSGLPAMVEGPAPGRERRAIDEQDRENVVADGLKTSHAPDKGNRQEEQRSFSRQFS